MSTKKKNFAKKSRRAASGKTLTGNSTPAATTSKKINTKPAATASKAVAAKKKRRGTGNVWLVTLILLLIMGGMFYCLWSFGADCLQRFEKEKALAKIEDYH